MTNAGPGLTDGGVKPVNVTPSFSLKHWIYNGNTDIYNLTDSLPLKKPNIISQKRMTTKHGDKCSGIALCLWCITDTCHVVLFFCVTLILNNSDSFCYDSID